MEGFMRNALRFAALALVVLPFRLAAQSTPVGDWKAVFVGPVDDRPKMVDAVTFSILMTPRGLIGTARASAWPGDLDVSDVELDGDRLTFTATGRKGWSTWVAGAPRKDHCCPKLLFVGMIQGDEMTLTMTWQSTEVGDDPNAAALPMKATRVVPEPAMR
jgi:hypothetical protein